MARTEYGARGALASSAKHSLRLKDRFALTHRLFFSGRSWDYIKIRSPSQRSILEHVSICSLSQFVHLHGKPYRLFFERELDRTVPSIGSLEHSLKCDPAGAETISKFARLHNAQFLSTYRSVCLHNSFTCMENRIDYFSSGSPMEPHRATSHSSILWNMIQIFFLFTFFRASWEPHRLFFRAGARTEPHQLGQISFSFFFIYRRASAYC